MNDMRPVFFATSDGDAARVEKLLDDRGVEYTVRLEVIEQRRASGLCYQGLLFEVPEPSAASCRRLFLEEGLQRGIMEE